MQAKPITKDSYVVDTSASGRCYPVVYRVKALIGDDTAVCVPAFEMVNGRPRYYRDNGETHRRIATLQHSPY